MTLADTWKKSWVQNLTLVVIAVIGVYALIYADVVSRARESYAEGEKYMMWNQNPAQKSKDLDKKFQDEKSRLDAALEKKKLTMDEYRKKLDAAQFDKEFALQESSLKYAYQWYKDTYELFSPPESKWVKMAREKAPQALALWKEELKSQNIPFEDTMFE